MSDPVVGLVQQLIRNQCVNDGSIESGYEERSVVTLTDFFGVEGWVYEPKPGRQSLVHRVRGWDPTAPTLALIPHLDVVPVDPDGWSVDPFTAEINDGTIYGRGALDMLNVAAAMAVAVKPYLVGDRTPRGDLIFCAVADEEGGGRWGAGRLVHKHWERVAADFVLAEPAYPALRRQGATTVPITIGEKGAYFTKLKTTGIPGHGSAPFGSVNAIDLLTDALQGIACSPAPIALVEGWADFVAGLDLSTDLAAGLSHVETVDAAIDDIAPTDLRLARHLHAVTHLTISANFIRGGDKANTVADRATAVLDIRGLPGMNRGLINAHLRRAMGSVAASVDISPIGDNDANISPADSPLWDAISDSVDAIDGHRNVVPVLTTATTDARFWRERGAVAYGVGLYDDQVDFSDLMTMFHGNDERVSVASLLRTTAVYEEIPARFTR